MIRPATNEDIPGISRIYEPIVRNTVVSFETDLPSKDEFEARISKSYEWIVYERAGQVIAYAYAAPFHMRAAYKWSVEVSVYVAADARGTGLGRELLSALLGRLLQRGFVNAFAGVALPNPASIGLFESLGFKQIALHEKVGYKLGAWHDVAWLQYRLRDASVPPPEIQ